MVNNLLTVDGGSNVNLKKLTTGLLLGAALVTLTVAADAANKPMRVTAHYGNIDPLRTVVQYGNIDPLRTVVQYGNIDPLRTVVQYGNIDPL
jgi:hypothetical protein